MTTQKVFFKEILFVRNCTQTYTINHITKDAILFLRKDIFLLNQKNKMLSDDTLKGVIDHLSELPAVRYFFSSCQVRMLTSDFFVCVQAHWRCTYLVHGASIQLATLLLTLHLLIMSLPM